MQLIRIPPPVDQNPLSFDIPLSTDCLELCKEYAKEFTVVRYTPIVDAPDEFADKYPLRQNMYGRNTEIFIVITLYNEDETLLARSLHALMLNISYLCSIKCPQTWGPNGWMNVVVCIVADGRSDMNSRTMSLLSVLGIFPSSFELPQILGSNQFVQAHLFELTTQISLDRHLQVYTHKQGVLPVQMILCLKERNSKKINSHRWFFNAFGRKLNPNICVTLDAGTEPSKSSLYHLWKAFDREPNLGGACGEICTDNNWFNFWNPLIAAQNFEYKISNLLDKPLEALFGYVQVLPGAFSAYKFIALQDGPLETYFQGEHTDKEISSIFKANMYLAEDRILCFELITKINSKWTLKYVSSAKAITDVPKTLSELISQRRRWLNGSFFAAVNSACHCLHIFYSNHSPFQKILFLIQNLYIVFNIFLTWFSIANFYILFVFIFDNSLRSDALGGYKSLIFTIVNYLYISCMIALLVISFGNRPQGSQHSYIIISLIMGLIMAGILALGFYQLYSTLSVFKSWTDFQYAFSSSSTLIDISISMASTFGLYLFSSLLYLDPWHVFTSLLQYLLLLPTWINVFMVFSFSNLHDVSWYFNIEIMSILMIYPRGTKGGNRIQMESAPGRKEMGIYKHDMQIPTIQVINDSYRDQRLYLKKDIVNERKTRDLKTKHDDYFRDYRTKILLFWIFSNIILVYLVLYSTLSSFDTKFNGQNVYLSAFFWTLTGIAILRFIGCLLYMIWIMMDKVRDFSNIKRFVPYKGYP